MLHGNYIREIYKKVLRYGKCGNGCNKECEQKAIGRFSWPPFDVVRL